MRKPSSRNSQAGACRVMASGPRTRRLSFAAGLKPGCLNNGTVELAATVVQRVVVLVNNAAISNTSKQPGISIQEYVQLIRPSNVPLDEGRAVWETNVFGVLAVTQAMLPLLREAPQARIVNVSSGVGSLTRNSDPTYPYRSTFGPVYPASKTAL